MKPQISIEVVSDTVWCVTDCVACVACSVLRSRNAGMGSSCVCVPAPSSSSPASGCIAILQRGAWDMTRISHGAACIGQDSSLVHSTLHLVPPPSLPPPAPPCSHSPWCYIGKRRLEKALQRYKGRADFSVHWWVLCSASCRSQSRTWVNLCHHSSMMSQQLPTDLCQPQRMPCAVMCLIAVHSFQTPGSSATRQ
jgi:hypothetical protein